MTIQRVDPGDVNEIQLSAAGQSDWIALKTVYNPFECSLTLSKGAADDLEASVEYINIPDPDAGPIPAERLRTIQFLTDGGLKKQKIELIGGVDYLDGPLEWPVSHIRLNVTAFASGTATLTVLQPGR
ncbi:hypothetical protein LCGC14_0452380 [marine sediment metagenome]|uniref:Uncharacterized protein n=1 Tax=marine sediment metagenome TaxID=412755 RepID=A0A0F9T0T9_9ZZZZ